MLIRSIKYLFSTGMQPKVPLYLLHPKLYHLNTKIVHREGDHVEFEDTIFHLQGGGQPNDKGWILAGENKFDIVGGTVDRETGTVPMWLYSCATSCQSRLRDCLWDHRCK
jgi:hypothetical protein